MKKFCQDVLDFLYSEYNDSYQFEVRIWTATPPHLIPGNNEKAELTIAYNNRYKLIVSDASMYYLFSCYRSGDYIKERGQFKWQKELIDMIEGG